jgi:hypothetical protein
MLVAEFRYQRRLHNVVLLPDEAAYRRCDASKGVVVRIPFY